LAAAATAATTGAVQPPVDPRVQPGGGTTARIGISSGKGKPASVEFSNERIKVDILSINYDRRLFGVVY
jgi:hypothetical protein